jgi:WD40 repeat protein/tRNA A-37 threonylcarbamoyl transferase component Bud32
LPPTVDTETVSGDVDGFAHGSAADSIVPGYEVLGILGKGGMGVVYKARQTGLKRLVALKMILPGSLGAGRVARFQAEAEAVARLVHPHIVQVYEIGEHGGRPYFSLEFVSGGSLAARLAKSPQPACASAALVETLARAVAYAHQQGVVHRDLKPANVLLQPRQEGEPADSLGSPKIADFGLAKQLDTDSGRTRDGEILGTPFYMAPEQAAGRANEVGPAADVYALGAILYETLTGRPPFRGPTLLDTLEQVRSREPVPPAQLQPRVPRDLDTICLKCLRKQPGARYASARDLAEDLRRFLAGEPIRARPVSRTERVRRWCLRNPGLASLGALLAVASLVAVVLPTVYAYRLDVALRESDRQRAEKTTALTDITTTLGLAASDKEGAPAQAVLWFAGAARSAGDDRERGDLNRLRVRTWSRQIWTPVRALPHDKQKLADLKFHPGGRFLLTRARGGECTVWDIDKEQPLPLPQVTGGVTAACWSPSGDRLVLASQGGVEILRFPELDVIERPTPFGPVGALAYSRDGRILAVAGDRLKLWDCARHAWLAGEAVHPEPIRVVVFAAGSDLLAAGTADDKVRVYAWGDNGLSAEPLFAPVPHMTEVKFQGALLPTLTLAPVFIRSGRELVTGSAGRWQWWEARTGKLLRTITHQVGTSPGFLEASPDGKYLALGSQIGRFWDVAKEELLLPQMPSAQLPLGAAFSPDGKRLLVGDSDHWARLWSIPDGRLMATFHLAEAVSPVAFAPDGRCAATGLANGLVRLWSPPEGNPGDRQFDSLPPWEWQHTAVSPDGRHILSLSGEKYPRPAQVYELTSGAAVGKRIPVRAHVIGAAFSPDGDRLALLDFYYRWKENPEGGWVEVWDWRTGRKAFEPIPITAKPLAAAFRPDGRQLVVLLETGVILDVDPETGEVRRKLQHPKDDKVLFLRHRSLQFTADGNTLVSAGCGSRVCVWDTRSGRLRYEPLKHEEGCADLDLSGDGRWLLTASYDHTVRVWDLATGQLHGQPLVHPNWVFQARFSRDGRQVLTACRDSLARLWDLETGELVCPPLGHGGEVHSAVFSPDGRWMFTDTNHGYVRYWRYPGGKPVTPSVAVDENAYSLDPTPDGRYLVVYSNKNLHALDLGDLNNPGLETLGTDDLCLWGELISGQRIAEGAGATNLTAAEWYKRWTDFRATHPDYPALPAPTPWQTPSH